MPGKKANKKMPKKMMNGGKSSKKMPMMKKGGSTAEITALHGRMEDVEDD
jgi:hypothetical protein